VGRVYPCHAALAMLPLLLLCLPWLPCPACPQHQRPAPRPALLPLPRPSSVLSATDPNTDTGEVPLTPLILICPVGTRHQKFRLCRLFPRAFPGRKHPPASTLSKKFISKNPACIDGGVGQGPWRHRGGVGLGPADPWPRGKVTQFPLDSIFRGRDGAMNGPQYRRFIVPEGRSAGAFRGAGAPCGQH
jgi:hypothetical protein